VRLNDAANSKRQEFNFFAILNEQMADADVAAWAAAADPVAYFALPSGRSRRAWSGFRVGTRQVIGA
jgi:hypothetical protein